MKLSEVKKFNEMEGMDTSTTEWQDTVKISFAESLNVVFDFMASVLNVEHIPEDLAAKIVERTGICKSILDCRCSRKNNFHYPDFDNVAIAAANVLETEMNQNKNSSNNDETVLDFRNFSIKFSYCSYQKIKYSREKIVIKAGLDKLSYQFGNPAYEKCFRSAEYLDLNPSGCDKAKDAGLLDSNDYDTNDIDSVKVVVTFKDNNKKEEK